jgi:hypothetical protein
LVGLLACIIASAAEELRRVRERGPTGDNSVHAAG